MTGVGNHHDVNVGSILIRASVVSAVLGAALVPASSALAGDPTASLPGAWSHAQINVVGPHGRAHTQIYDRGRVQSLTSSSLTLKESDGSLVTIQVASGAIVVIDGQPGSLSQIQAGYWARTLGIDGLPAKRVSATAPKPPKPSPKVAAPRAVSTAASSTPTTPASATPTGH